MTEQEIDDYLKRYAILEINGIKILDPSPSPPFVFSKKELDIDSGRNLDGVMERNILSHHPRTLSLKFPSMNGKQMKSLLSILDNPIMNIKAFDPFINDVQTVTMKVMHGDLTTSLDRFIWDYEKNKPLAIYNEFSVELVEY